ncbi:MAG TPA: DUF4338 domain-containing protein [Candidatus Paceibacterota bacterium]|nr:DUF4338 domain-containing protein [Candidatus Paceibacterota bacterium]
MNSGTDPFPVVSSLLVGETLRYVAELDGQWMALVAFSAPALHVKGCEGWIGWSARQRARRLGLVVNNSRYLVLPERKRYPNLASRVLGLCLQRLSVDWQARWGHPVLVVESFVEGVEVHENWRVLISMDLLPCGRRACLACVAQLWV